MKLTINSIKIGFICIFLVSCAHQSTIEKYGKAYASLSGNSKYQISKNTLELADNGFTIKGTLNNRPKNLIAVFEYTPENLFLIDTTRTDSLGNFELKGVLNEEKICYIQFGPNAGFPIALNNKSKMQLSITETNMGISYDLKGTEITSAQQIKTLLELNSGYLFKLNAMQQQFMSYSQNSNQEQALSLQKQMLNLDNQRRKAVVADFKAFEEPSIAPYFAIQYLLQDAELPDLKSAYDICYKYAPNSSYTKTLKFIYDQNKGTAIGSPAPEIKQKTPEGKYLTLSSLKGKVVLIDFWASWCRPCMAAMPEVKAIYAKYKDQGLEILGVSFDRDSNSWANTIKSQNLSWKHVSDLKYWSNEASKPYQVSSIPATYLIDKKGNIAAKNLHGPALELKIEELLKETTP